MPGFPMKCEWIDLYVSQFLSGHILSPFILSCDFSLGKSLRPRCSDWQNFKNLLNALLLRKEIELNISDVSGVYIILGERDISMY